MKTRVKAEIHNPTSKLFKLAHLYVDPLFFSWKQRRNAFKNVYNMVIFTTF